MIFARFEFCCTGHRERSRTFSKVVLDVEGARLFRGGEQGQGQLEHARHDAGASPPLPRTAHDVQLGRRSPCAYARPPQIVDPSASHARAPSLILQPPTVCACSTLSQAQISRARPRAASAAPRAAARQQVDFDAMAPCVCGGSRPQRLCTAPFGPGAATFGAFHALESRYTRLGAVEAVSLRNLCIVFRLKIL